MITRRKPCDKPPPGQEIHSSCPGFLSKGGFPIAPLNPFGFLVDGETREILEGFPIALQTSFGLRVVVGVRE